MFAFRELRKLSQFLIVASIALSNRSAAADDPKAEAMFQEGRAMMLEGRFAEACPRIAESHRLDPHVGTLLNLAACHEKMGKVGSAWVEYQQALTTAQAEGQTDRERLARDRIAALEPRVPWLTLSVPPSSTAHGLAITLDGSPFLPLAWGKDVPADPGPHVVVATAPNRKPLVEQFSLRESEHKTVTVPALEAIGHAQTQTRATQKSEPEPPPKSDPPSRWILETGLFAAYMGVATDEPRLSDPGSIEVRDNHSSPTSYSNCASAGCGGRLDKGGGGVAGVNLYAAYAISDNLHLGARLLGGARFGGGALVAIGPSVGVHVAGPVWTGAGIYMAEADVTGTGSVTPDAGHSLTSTSRVPMEASISGPALGIDLTVRLREFSRGSLLAGIHPLFIVPGYGSSAVALPVGLSYRFQ